MTYFRKGFGLKAAIEGQLTADYHSAVVEALARQRLPAHGGTAHLPARPGIRLLLRSGSRGRIRL